MYNTQRLGGGRGDISEVEMPDDKQYETPWDIEQSSLFDGTTKKVKGRLSFFKRLSWQNGQSVASWEDVLVCTRR